MQTEADLNTTLERIALENLGISTLEARNSDSLDFHELSVWELKKALEAALREGARIATRAAVARTTA